MLVTFCAQVASFCSNTLTQSNTPLMHCSGNDSLVEVTPLFNKSLLQMVKVSNAGMAHAFLEHTAILRIVDRIQVR